MGIVSNLDRLARTPVDYLRVLTEVLFCENKLIAVRSPSYYVAIAVTDALQRGADPLTFSVYDVTTTLSISEGAPSSIVTEGTTIDPRAVPILSSEPFRGKTI
jgi:hypothetical protein